MAKSRSSSTSSSSSSSSSSSASQDHSGKRADDRKEDKSANKYSASDVVAQLPSLWRHVRRDSSSGPSASKGTEEGAEPSSSTSYMPFFRGRRQSTKTAKKLLTSRSSSSESLLQRNSNTLENNHNYLSIAPRNDAEQPSTTCKSRMRSCWGALLVYLCLRKA
ncbi:hypothetical protein K445DRAFT_23954 [Daldinia sp. EC12]|nr:hypothetical protein F4774DRAFT_410558 [Daldinia eschscholtzii]OTB14173.1 hypothetical protein K445DRAFT_23954 [Daldinia sp. EC12]